MKPRHGNDLELSETLQNRENSDLFSPTQEKGPYLEIKDHVMKPRCEKLKSEMLIQFWESTQAEVFTIKAIICYRFTYVKYPFLDSYTK